MQNSLCFFNKMLHTCYFKEFHAQGRRTMSRSWTVLCNWIRLPVQVLGSVDVWVGGWSGVSVCILSCLCPHLLFGHPALPPPYPSLCHPPPPLELIHFASSLSFLLRHPLTFSPLTFSSLLLFSAHCHCHFTCPQTTLLQLCYASVLLPPPPQHTHILPSLLPPPPPKWLNQNITQTRLLGF